MGARNGERNPLRFASEYAVISLVSSMSAKRIICLSFCPPLFVTLPHRVAWATSGLDRTSKISPVTRSACFTPSRPSSRTKKPRPWYWPPPTHSPIVLVSDLQFNFLHPCSSCLSPNFNLIDFGSREMSGSLARSEWWWAFNSLEKTPSQLVGCISTPRSRWAR